MKSLKSVTLMLTALLGMCALTYAQSGCTIVGAINYDPLAVTDDGSCAVLDCYPAPYSIDFTKLDFADTNDEASQDRVTADVWLTRGNENGIINAFSETSWTFGVSAVGTLWKLGAYDPADDAMGGGVYTNFRDHNPGNMINLPGQTSTLYIISENLYFNIEWTQWTCCAGGGGFAYTRTLAAAPDCSEIPLVSGCTNSDAVNFDGTANFDDGTCDFLGCTDDTACNYDPIATIDDASCTNTCLGCLIEDAINFDPTANTEDGSCLIYDCVDLPFVANIQINRPNYVGFADEDTQDRIAPDVWLARENNGGGLFNAFSETGWDQGTSALGTLWKLGNYDPSDDAMGGGVYTNFRDHNPGNMENLPGQTSTVYIISENKYYEFEWNSWTSNSNGGGFAYIRTLVAAPDCGTVAISSGCADVAAVNYDATANFDDGSCDYLGCTDGSACNYDEQATIDDGTCTDICLGCTADQAVNYDPIANIDDGSCLIIDCFDPPYDFIFTRDNNVGFDTEESQDRISADVWLARENGEGGLFNAFSETGWDQGTSAVGTLWKLGNYDLADDAMGGGVYTDFRDHNPGNMENLPGQTSSLYVISLDLYFEIEWISWTSGGDGGGFSYRRTLMIPDDCNTIGTTVGCTDETASNYDPSAVIDDGSCPVLGCTDFDACNYNPNANEDAGNCTYPSEDFTLICTEDINVVQTVGDIDAEVCYATPALVGGPCSQNLDIESTLEVIQDSYGDWLSILPNTYNFVYDGSNDIDDGGGDMYDGGNELTLGQQILYSNGVILPVGDATYFTEEFPGMFVFYADGDLGNSFSVNGNLGADGSGLVNAYEYENGSSGTIAFYKGVCSAGDPSVNHLIITTNNGSPFRSYANDTNNDNHTVSGLSDENTILHILWAGNGGYCYSEAEVEALYDAVLNDLSFSGSNLTLVSGLPSGSDFPVGTTSISYAYDDGENQFSCDFDVTVHPYAGCTDQFAPNYNSYAVVDDGSCEFIVDCQGRYEGLITTTFTKDDFADWLLEENQDRINETTWITRQNSQGLFNIFDQTSYSGMVGGPSNTEWYLGTSDDPQTYTTWIDAAQNNPSIYCNNDIDMTLKVIDADLYFDVEWHNFSGGGPGGGFSYTRTLNMDLSGCTTEEFIAGCTDEEADNYNPNANVDDGSCAMIDVCEGDFNNDGLVNTTDLLVFLTAFGTVCL